MKKILLIVFILLGSIGYTQPRNNGTQPRGQETHPCDNGNHYGDPHCPGAPISSALPALLVLGAIYGFRKQK